MGSQLSSLYFSVASNLPCSDCNEAAKYGNLNELKRLHEAGHPITKKTCELAATSSLECLQYLHECGCPWDWTTTANAVSWGRLDTFMYALEHGCTRDLEFAASLASRESDIQKFKLCFQYHDHSNRSFFEYPHYYKLDTIVNEIDLEDPVWQPVFNDAHLHNYPTLQSKVNTKIAEKERMKRAALLHLDGKICVDIIKNCLNLYI